MKILIAGGAGFIGSHLGDKLIAKNHQVLVLDDLSSGRKENINPQAQFIKLDINSQKLGKVIADFKPEAIYHLAAQKSVSVSFLDPKLDAQINIIGSLNILQEALKQKVKRFIFVSSAAVYGALKERPTSERVKTEPLSPYGLSKLVFEKYLPLLANHKLIWTVIRPANVYGPRQDTQGEAGVIAIFINNIINNSPLNVNGDGQQTRDYVYVADLVQGLVKALKKRGGIFNIGTGQERTVNDLVKYLKEISKKEIKVKKRVALQGEIKYSCLDLRKAQKELNFKPQFSIKKGLELTYQWFKNKK